LLNFKCQRNKIEFESLRTSNNDFMNKSSDNQYSLKMLINNFNEENITSK